MPTDIRIDLQVEGMGVRGHRWVFITQSGNSWDDVDKIASALCAVHHMPVEATMTEYEPVHTHDGEFSHMGIIQTRLIGRFVPYGFAPRGSIFIDADIYAQVD